MAGRKGSPRSQENRDLWSQRADRRHVFAEDNTHGDAVKHGAQSPKALAPLVDSLVTEIVEAVPVLGESRYSRAVRAWAVAEARCERLREYVAGLPLEELSPERGAAGYELRSEQLAAKLRSELALTLASHAVIAKSDFGKHADSDKARSMIGKLFGDIQRVVAEGRVGELETAAEARE